MKTFNTIKIQQWTLGLGMILLCLGAQGAPNENLLDHTLEDTRFIQVFSPVTVDVGTETYTVDAGSDELGICRSQSKQQFRMGQVTVDSPVVRGKTISVDESGTPMGQPNTIGTPVKSIRCIR